MTTKVNRSDDPMDVWPTIKRAMEEAGNRRYLVRFNVEYSREILADSEQAAIDKALALGDDGWDQVATSQCEAEEV